jgi:hypothetical protein
MKLKKKYIMKKRKVLLAGFIALGGMLTAQNSNPWPTSGFVGIGTNSPGFLLDVVATSVYTNGIRVTQAGAQGPAALWLNNNTSSGGNSGHNWTLYSLGVNDAPGAGNFCLTDNTAGANRMFVSGSTGYVGINNTTPGNRLEITGASGNSGLRFSNLNWSSTPGTNGGNLGVLALNNVGDVIYVKNPSWGNPCTGGTANPLSANWELRMATFNLMNNETTAGGTSQFGVGHVHGTCSNALGKFEVYNNVASSSLYIANYGRTDVSGTPAYQIGTAGAIGDPSTVLSLKNAGTTIGVYGYNPQPALPTVPVPDRWAGYFDGDVKITGSGSVTGMWTTSDKRFKKDVTSLIGVTEKLKKVGGYTYSFKTEEYKSSGFDGRKHIGVLAQEIKEVFPELVKEDGNGFYAVDYQGLVPVLIEGFKEQQKQIEKLENALQTAISKNDQLRSTPSQNIDLSDKNSIVLDQNVPNPFAETTVINYNLPSDFTKAQIIFTTNEGRIIKTIDITVKGKGSLNVFANDLTSGMYSYSLVVDGRTIDTKKMIKN